MEWIRKGRAWVFGDNICPDIAIGYPISDILGDLREVKDRREFKKIFMVRLDPTLPNKVKKGDFIVAGKNFGVDRVHAPFWVSLEEVGISGIIAESFSERFFRESVSRGFPILECENITKKVENGDELMVDFKLGLIKNLRKNEDIKAKLLPDIILEIIESGGALHWLKKKVDRIKKT